MTTESPIELTIVVPTLRERNNVSPLVECMCKALPSIVWEVIFVDDNSGDGTADEVWNLGRSDRRVRCMKRIGRRGLSSACIEGMLATGAPFIAVMDADLQHDPTLLAPMLDVLRKNQADMVIASRYTAGGSVGNWEPSRVRISLFATRLARLITKQRVSDPMSGYFMLRREVFESAVDRLSSLGFKILLDIIASTRGPLRLAEVPLRFGKRHAGESKLSANVAWEFLLLIGDKIFGRYVPVRFVAFGLIGAAGTLVHFAVLTLAFKGLEADFPSSQTAAAAIAMVFNYSINNVLTYGEVSRRGWRWLSGLASFMAICGVGAITNVGIASYLFREHTSWPLAAIAGILVGAVWNYAVSSRYTWRT